MHQRVLLVHRYFWPDVPTYAQMLRYIGAQLNADGHDVSVFCGPATYNDVYMGPPRPRSEVVDGVRVIRVPLPPDDKRKPLVRAVSMMTFAVRLVAHVIRHRRDYTLITVTTIPPVIMGVAAQLIARLTGIPYLYHCMDLYPEVLEVGGKPRRGPLLRFAKWIDKATCEHAAAVIVLSTDMAATLKRRGLDSRNTVVLNNFEISEPGGTADNLLPRRNAYRVLFAGNMGRFQGLETLIRVAHRVAPELPDVDFVLMGAGAEVKSLRAQAGDLLGRTVHFLDHQPVAEAAAVMRDSHLAVISLQPRIHEVAYPSKTAMYLTAGCRIAAIVEDDSDLARLIVAEDLGRACRPGDIDALAAIIRHEYTRGPSSDTERARIAAVGEREFGRTSRLQSWSSLIPTIGARRG